MGRLFEPRGNALNRGNYPEFLRGYGGSPQQPDLIINYVMKALQGKGLITDTVIAQIQSQKHSGFSVWWGEEIEPGEQRRIGHPTTL